MKRHLWLPLLLLLAAIAGIVRAADTSVRGLDRGQVQVSTGTAWVDVSIANYTSAQALLTIEPQNSHALQDCRVMLDLNRSGSGFQAAGYTTETIQFRVSRRVDGSNWRRDNTKKYPATALAADDSASEGIEIPLGLIDPDGAARIEVVLSAEDTGDIAIPYRVIYRSGANATITAQSN